jgi:hypothetical protein
MFGSRNNPRARGEFRDANRGNCSALRNKIGALEPARRQAEGQRISL